MPRSSYIPTYSIYASFVLFVVFTNIYSYTCLCDSFVFTQRFPVYRLNIVFLVVSNIKLISTSVHHRKCQSLNLKKRHIVTELRSFLLIYRATLNMYESHTKSNRHNNLKQRPSSNLTHSTGVAVAICKNNKQQHKFSID